MTVIIQVMVLWGLNVVLLAYRLAYEAGYLLQEEVLALDGSLDQTVGRLAGLLSDRGVSKAELHRGDSFDYVGGLCSS